MFNDEASGAVRIFRQTSSAGTEISPPCAPYSACQSRKFIATQNAAMKKNVRRWIMRNSRRRQVDDLADVQVRRLQTEVGREQGGQADAVFAGDGGGRFAGGNGVRARSGRRRFWICGWRRLRNCRC